MSTKRSSNAPKHARRPPDLKLNSSSLPRDPHSPSSRRVVASVVERQTMPEVDPTSGGPKTFSRTEMATQEDTIRNSPRATSSQSATSSLDPYYFSPRSPPPRDPVTPETALATSSSVQTISETAARADGLSADRRGLVGVGELTTPRWNVKDSSSRSPTWNFDLSDLVISGLPSQSKDMGEDDIDVPDSPWTIEAIDGDPDSGSVSDPSQLLDTLVAAQTSPRTVRTRPSITSESGGDEVLYPRRKRTTSAEFIVAADASLRRHTPPSPTISPRLADIHPSIGPHARKRTSDEFVLDHSDDGKPAVSFASLDLKEERIASRPGLKSQTDVRASNGKAREKRKPDSIRLPTPDRKQLPSHGQHSRHTSNSSSSSYDTNNISSLRHIPTDFSHLPPSPSSSSIRHFLRTTTSVTNVPSTATPNRIIPTTSSPSAAHSLLRGMQEGWSALDDQTTVEVLRKLDGVSGKGIKSRFSISGASNVKVSSRPGTPGVKTGIPSDQWEGLGADDVDNRNRGKRGSSTSIQSAIKHPEEGLHSISTTPARKSSLSTSSARSSLAAKRSSASTAPSSVASNDGVLLPPGQSATSTSSSSKTASRTGRNSAGSDVLASHSEGNRPVHLSGAQSYDAGEELVVPPVPPLPKDVVGHSKSYLSKLGDFIHSSADHSNEDSFEGLPLVIGSNSSESEDLDRTMTADLLQSSQPDTTGVDFDAHDTRAALATESRSIIPTPHKTPVKKWSFSSALNLRLGSAVGAASLSGDSKSWSSQSPKSSPFLPVPEKLRTNGASILLQNQEKMQQSSAAPLSPAVFPIPTDLEDRSCLTPSRADTTSSSTTTKSNAVAMSPDPQRAFSKRLTPSAIPFFRRSSSQAMQASHGRATSSSPTFDAINSVAPRASLSSEDVLSSQSVSSVATRKNSMLSLGLPGLLKGSSSRRSLQSERGKNDTRQGRDDSAKPHDPVPENEVAESRPSKHRPRTQKDDKERSESRISILMGRRRGKTVSSADKQKAKPVEALPPIQIAAIPASTVQRVASFRNDSSSSSGSHNPRGSSSAVSRLSAATISSMAKQSDSSLRSRNGLPTIAGSPSVHATSNSKDASSLPNTTSLHTAVLAKETPTKIPRISGRSSISSPPPSSKTSSSRRTSLGVPGATVKLEDINSSSSHLNLPDEFGALDNPNGISSKHLTATRSRASPHLRSSLLIPAPSSTGSLALGGSQKSKRDSISFGGLRKSSTGSTLSSTSQAPANEGSLLRFSALSPSKSLKFLTPKSSISSTRLSSSLAHGVSPSSSRQSLSTPSPVQVSVDEDEIIGDEEMLAWMKRQQSKKAANPAKQEELEDLLRVPETFAAATPCSVNELISGSDYIYLSDYERKEIQEYTSIYYFGARSNKKQATLDNATNNYGYDDERGDYLVIGADHLAYRYEIVDTLGKGSFGQVLRCRDHRSGESVAIKIIRNKKRFHHQALVEIKILDNLRKWDPDEKHFVIKMTEYFYFRNHLCIAMELLSINLYELIKANGFVGFTTTLIRRFTSQLLASLTLMRHHRIVHCDLKPENVLLKHPAKSAIKVIDFGSSCLEHEKVYTYIQSRFYRSPEVILGMNYHMAIDMWSLGCILAELYTGFPIFPGENEQEQLSCIMEVLGPPEKDLVNRSSRKRLFFDSTGAPRPVVNSKGRRRRPGTKTLAQVLRCDDELFLDFVSKCLMWDPERRLKPQPAMRHPYMTATRRLKLPPSTPSSTARTLLHSSSTLASGSKSKVVNETPRKSQIGAPTPLTARLSRVPTTSVPSTPVSSALPPSIGSSVRGLRASQPGSAPYQSLSTRALSSYAISNHQ